MIYDTIKQTVLLHLPQSRVLLFGSRARGDHDKHSDYDLMVITPNPITRTEKLNWHATLNKEIVRAIHSPIDLLLFSESEVLEKNVLPGHIVRSAIREGIAL